MPLIVSLKWIDANGEKPEYNFSIGGTRFVNLLLADKDGSVWPGDYTEGKFMVFGVEHPHITHWMEYPEHPEQ